MTHYSKSNEAQRNDRELKDAIAAELEQHRIDLVKTISHMKEAYEILKHTSKLAEDASISRSSRIQSAKRDLFSAMDSLGWFAEFLEDVSDTYYGNVAAFMTEHEATMLKDKWSKDFS